MKNDRARDEPDHTTPYKVTACQTCLIKRFCRRKLSMWPNLMKSNSLRRLAWNDVAFHMWPTQPDEQRCQRRTRLHDTLQSYGMPKHAMLDDFVEKVEVHISMLRSTLFSLSTHLQLDSQPPRTFQAWSTYSIESLLQRYRLSQRPYQTPIASVRCVAHRRRQNIGGTLNPVKKFTQTILSTSSHYLLSLNYCVIWNKLWSSSPSRSHRGVSSEFASAWKIHFFWQFLNWFDARRQSPWAQF